MQTVPNTSTDRAKVIVTSKLLLFSKLGSISALELGRGVTADDNPKGCQETEGNLHVEISSDSPMPEWRRQQHDDRLPAKL
ncbi:hypothetical protein Acr_28g0004180 [Actinidia rufa]|uniref:Uncharacterized protein n=1 Tax=Actinidia rufa TaxID=165716 RepID=A0A7J0H9C4_9ERIC|nr:hypothetical protein Acr_28g0004180 [Actinidia rufa]